MTVSSSCGWNTLTRKSSRNDVNVLMAMSECGGTMSFNRSRKDSEGGRSSVILKTLGSTSSLCPATCPSLAILVSLWLTPDRRWDFETSPGTEV